MAAGIHFAAGGFGMPMDDHKKYSLGGRTTNGLSASKRRATIATARAPPPFGDADNGEGPSNGLRYNAINEDGSETGTIETIRARPLRVHGNKDLEDSFLRRYELSNEPNTEILGTIVTSKETESKVIIKKTFRTSLQAASDIDREITILSAAQDPSILPLIEALELDQVIWTVKEYRPLQTVAQLVSLYGPMPETTLKPALNQLFSGLAALFMAGFAHLRVCDQTICFDNNRQLIITGIEYACEYGKEKSGDLYAATQEKFGDDIYVAPEVYACTTYNARKATIWSCGVLLYFMVTGQTEKLSNITHPSLEDPFQDSIEYSTQRTRSRKLSTANVQSKIILYPNRFEVPNYARWIIPKMLAHDPLRRAEFIEVATRIPKEYADREARTLIEMAWLDYKHHVGPYAGLETSAFNDSSSSIFSFASNMSNLSNLSGVSFRSLLGRGHSRRKSAPVNSPGW